MGGGLNFPLALGSPESWELICLVFFLSSRLSTPLQSRGEAVTSSFFFSSSTQNSFQNSRFPGCRAAAPRGWSNQNNPAKTTRNHADMSWVTSRWSGGLPGMFSLYYLLARGDLRIHKHSMKYEKTIWGKHLRINGAYPAEPSDASLDNRSNWFEGSFFILWSTRGTECKQTATVYCQQVVDLLGKVDCVTHESETSWMCVKPAGSCTESQSAANKSIISSRESPYELKKSVKIRRPFPSFLLKHLNSLSAEVNFTPTPRRATNVD